jgi:putative FmdB family regulatory protein
MPTYEYKCRKCGKKFERNEHISEHGLKRTRCPKCESTKVAQVLGAFFAKTSKKS